jgi:NHL repeat
LGNAIYIAMAGSHQIWGLDLKRELIGPFAGSGGENIVDGPAKDALLAQPSGITTDGALLYFADSETSSIRAVTLGPDAIVSTIVGCGLFEFGDQDGTGDVVRMQHPLGIAFHDGALYVADTYNGKIKRVVPATREVRTLAYGFDEPGGVAAADGKLYVADTNNHAIRIVDLETFTVGTLMLRSLEKLKPRASAGGWTGEALERSPVSVRPGHIQILLDPRLPEGLKLNTAAPNRLLIRSDSPALLFENGVAAKLIDRPKAFPIEVPADVTGEAKLTVFAEIYYCHEGDEGLCFYKEILISVPVLVSPGSNSAMIDLGFPV